jgi:hypothetical protein
MAEAFIPATDIITTDGLLELIKSLERDEGSNLEVTSLRSEQSGDNPNLGLNFVGFIGNMHASTLPAAHVAIISGTAAEQEAKIQEISETNLLLDWKELFVQGPGQGAPSFQNVLFYREGRTITWKGQMSWFGGKDDTDMPDQEPLAIVQNDNFDYYKKYFVDEKKGGDGTFPHAKNLNPETYYIACRWDYWVTPRTQLKDCTIMVSHRGMTARAEAVDWGPNEDTGRVADVSKGLADHLGLTTDQVCEVKLTLPVGLLQSILGGAPGDGVRYLKQSQIIALFDDPRPTTPAGGGKVTPRPGFESNLIIPVEIPSLMGIEGAPAFGKVRCHRRVAAALQAAFAEVHAQELTGQILTWDGMYVPRHMGWDQSRPLSRHTWGIAFDINAGDNPYNQKPAKPGAKGSVHALVPIFEKHGFFWGGYFKDAPDGMHFEWGRVTV